MQCTTTARLRAELGLTLRTVARARRDGKLRFARQGHRILYLGQWVVDWLQADSRFDVMPRRGEETTSCHQAVMATSDKCQLSGSEGGER